MKKLVFILMLYANLMALGQTAEITKYKSMFTLNFIRYIGWPEASKQGDFVIGVVKDANLAENIKNQTVGKKFGYQNIVVKEFNNADEVTDCQLLYFSSNQSFSRNADAIKQKLLGKNSLLITETEGAIKNGSMINFVIRDNKLKFEISNENAEAFGLKFSGALTSLTNAIVK